MNACDAARKTVGRVEERRIRIGDLLRKGQEVDGDFRAAVLREREVLCGFAGPDRPVSEQAASDAMDAIANSVINLLFKFAPWL